MITVYMLLDTMVSVEIINISNLTITDGIPEECLELRLFQETQAGLWCSHRRNGDPRPYLEYQAEIQNDLYIAATAKSLQSCPTLCDPVDGRDGAKNNLFKMLLETELRRWYFDSHSC